MSFKDPRRKGRRSSKGKNRESNNIDLHVLIYLWHVREPHDTTSHQVHHKNGEISDNRFTNLELLSRENHGKAGALRQTEYPNSMKHIKRIILTTLSEHTNVSSADRTAFQTVFDDKQGRYQVIVLGWVEDKYVVDTLVYLELRGDLIWLHADNTDWGIGEKLLLRGVPKDRIVIGWLTPFMRQHSGFASGEAA